MPRRPPNVRLVDKPPTAFNAQSAVAFEWMERHGDSFKPAGTVDFEGGQLIAPGLRFAAKREPNVAGAGFEERRFAPLRHYPRRFYECRPSSRPALFRRRRTGVGGGLDFVVERIVTPPAQNRRMDSAFGAEIDVDPLFMRIAFPHRRRQTGLTCAQC